MQVTSAWHRQLRSIYLALRLLGWQSRALFWVPEPNFNVGRERTFSHTPRQFSDHWLGVLQPNSILPVPGDSIRSTGTGLGPTKLQSTPHPPLQMPIASPNCHLCFGPTDYKAEVPMTPSSDFQTLIPSPGCHLDC